MKKLFYLGLTLFVVVFSLRWFINSVQTNRYNGVQAQGITNSTEYPTLTRTPAPTSTQIPSPTIDYQQTAMVAQSTADEARRINSMATAEYLRLINEQLAMTQVVEQNNFTIMSWTQQAAATVIPLTATQQAVNNTQIPMEQLIMSAQLTATKGAPTQLVAMENAQNYVKFAETNERINVAGKLSLIVFILGILVFMFIYPMPAKSEPIETEEKQELETVVWVKNTKDNGAASARLVIPCTPDQLTELAEKITQGEKTLAINQWEGKDTLFTRDVILQVRTWLRQNNFVIPTDDGQLAPTGELFDFLCGWLESKNLPSGYDFALHSPEKSDPANHTENPHDSIILMRNHAHDRGGGGSYPDLAVDNSK